MIEIFHPKAINLMYWNICAEMRLDYYYLLAIGEQSPEGVDEHVNAEDVTVDLNDLRRILQVAGVD